MSFLDRLFGRIWREKRTDDTFSLIAEHSADVIFRFRSNGKVRYISPSAERLLGWTPKEIIDQGGDVDQNGIVHPADKERVSRAVADHFAGKFDELKLEFRVCHRDGRAIWVETNGRIVPDPETGLPTDIVFSMRDISEKKALELELAALARTDPLTGLANRRAFDEVLEQEWAATLAAGSEISLLLLDVDHFKTFNDSNGHQVGDDCLRSVAAALRLASEASSLVARYGGEEFAVTLPRTGSSEAIAAGERLCAAVRAIGIPHPFTGRALTISVGAATAIATVGGTMRMPEGLLQAADMALYKAKERGRDRVETALLLSPVQQAAGS